LNVQSLYSLPYEEEEEEEDVVLFGFSGHDATFSLM
jgi:hypothetical protein